jgi:hypothetical protein
MPHPRLFSAEVVPPGPDRPGPSPFPRSGMGFGCAPPPTPVRPQSGAFLIIVTGWLSQCPTPFPSPFLKNGIGRGEKVFLMNHKNRLCNRITKSFYINRLFSKISCLCLFTDAGLFVVVPHPRPLPIPEKRNREGCRLLDRPIVHHNGVGPLIRLQT